MLILCDAILYIIKEHKFNTVLIYQFTRYQFTKMEMFYVKQGSKHSSVFNHMIKSATHSI